MIGHSGSFATAWDVLIAFIAVTGMLGAMVWLWHLGHLVRHRHLLLFLSDVQHSEASPEPPGEAKVQSTVAVIFAARDEAAMVEAATRSMLAEATRDPSIRVVAVDDRSTDGTGLILDRIAATDPHLGVVHVAAVPANWLGKTHAVQVGSESPAAAGARWLLLTDADVLFGPGTIRRAVDHAESVGADHLVVAPEFVTRSVDERIFLTLFALLLSIYAPIGWLVDRRRRTHIGVGAFNLVRGEVWRAIGGFRHLAMSVDDDIRLGQTLKYAGYQTRFLLGAGAVSLRWHVGAWGMIRGTEKNFFAGLKFSLARVVLVVGGLWTVAVAPFAAIFVGPGWSRLLAAGGIAAVCLIMALTRRQSRIGWVYGLTLPIAALLILVAMIRSVATTMLGHGVRWRGSHYPLKLLKAHIRERDAWLAEVWQSTR